METGRKFSDSQRQLKKHRKEAFDKVYRDHKNISTFYTKYCLYVNTNKSSIVCNFDLTSNKYEEGKICTCVTTSRGSIAIAVTICTAINVCSKKEVIVILRNITNFHMFIYFMPPLYQFRIQQSFTDYALTKE